jgi:hypothetical protein
MEGSTDVVYNCGTEIRMRSNVLTDATACIGVVEYAKLEACPPWLSTSLFPSFFPLLSFLLSSTFLPSFLYFPSFFPLLSFLPCFLASFLNVLKPILNALKSIS